MFNLLAIPNDRSDSYDRIPRSDFKEEFNPSGLFNSVQLLNWKDEEITSIDDIKSIPIISDKAEGLELLASLATGKISYEDSSIQFREFFKKHLDELKQKVPQSKLIRAFNTHFAAELGDIVRSITGAPLIVSAHDVNRLTSSVSLSDQVICISDNLANLCTEQYGIKPKKIVVIPDSINTDLFYRRTNSEISSYINQRHQTKYKILSVSRVVPGKNIENLLRAIGLVRDKLGNEVTHIHIGANNLNKFSGDISSKSEVDKIHHQLELEETSYFIGVVPKKVLPIYYSWADVFCLPTLYEGLGRVLIEALACETPAVTTNRAPMNTIVVDGYNGFTANPLDPEELAQKILVSLEDKTRNLIMANTRKSIMGRFDHETVRNMHVENYSRFMNH